MPGKRARKTSAEKPIALLPGLLPSALGMSVIVWLASTMKSGIASDTIEPESSSVYITFVSGGLTNRPGVCETPATAGITHCKSRHAAIVEAQTRRPRR